LKNHNGSLKSAFAEGKVILTHRSRLIEAVTRAYDPLNHTI